MLIKLLELAIPETISQCENKWALAHLKNCYLDVFIYKWYLFNIYVWTGFVMK